MWVEDQIDFVWVSDITGVETYEDGNCTADETLDICYVTD
jgi:hypothetical protein